MSHLEVPGAKLYYESVGTGPTLLCISGANGNADPWREFANCLKDHFTVVTYDRSSLLHRPFKGQKNTTNKATGRGFSRSGLTDAQDYENRIETDADDAARLIKHISPEPAVVLGNSSGALVSMKLLIRHPDVVRTLLPYEPPAIPLLPDFEQLANTIDEIYNVYRAKGTVAAYPEFMKLVKFGNEAAQTRSHAARYGESPYLFSNQQYWFEREIRQYTSTKFNIEDLDRQKTKMILLNGEESDKEALQYRANIVIAEKLGLDVYHVPGGHLGHILLPERFSKRLLEVLEHKN